jgi:hypothetical protein
MRKGGKLLNRVPSKGPWYIISPPRLKVLNLTGSVCIEMDTLPFAVIFTSMGQSSFFIEFRNNGIKNLVNPYILSAPTNLSIDLSDNQLSRFAPEVFMTTSKLGSNRSSSYSRGTISRHSLNKTTTDGLSCISRT